MIHQMRLSVVVVALGTFPGNGVGKQGYGTRYGNSASTASVPPKPRSKLSLNWLATAENQGEKSIRNFSIDPASSIRTSIADPVFADPVSETPKKQTRNLPARPRPPKKTLAKKKLKKSATKPDASPFGDNLGFGMSRNTGKGEKKKNRGKKTKTKKMKLNETGLLVKFFDEHFLHFYRKHGGEMGSQEWGAPKWRCVSHKKYLVIRYL